MYEVSYYFDGSPAPMIMQMNEAELISNNVFGCLHHSTIIRSIKVRKVKGGECDGECKQN